MDEAEVPQPAEDLISTDTPYMELCNQPPEKKKRPWFLKRLYLKIFRRNSGSPPLAHPPAQELTPKQKTAAKESMGQMRPEDKFLQFFSNAPFWTVEPPKTSFLNKIFSFFQSNEISYVKCVFASRTSEPKYGYFPYSSKDKYLFLPDGRIYDIPQAGDVWFFDADHHLPILNARDPENEYDLPTHYATAIHNDGIQYGKVSAYKDLVEAINSIKTLTTIMAAVTGLTILAAYLLVRQVGGNYEMLAAEVHALQLLIGGV